MKKIKISISLFYILWCCLYSLISCAEKQRIEETKNWQADRCERYCGAEFQNCETKKFHERGSCSEAYIECLGNCEPSDPTN